MALKKNTITIYNDCVVVRMHNKRITIVNNGDEKDEVTVYFNFADENANIPAVEHSCSKNKIRNTRISISEDALIALFSGYSEFKKNKEKKQNKENN